MTNAGATSSPAAGTGSTAGTTTACRFTTPEPAAAATGWRKTASTSTRAPNRPCRTWARKWCTGNCRCGARSRQGSEPGPPAALHHVQRHAEKRLQRFPPDHFRRRTGPEDGAVLEQQHMGEGGHDLLDVMGHV